MPEVRSSGESERYMKRLAEAEDEIRKEAARSEESREERVKRAEESAKRALAEKDEAYKAEISRLKENSGRASDEARARDVHDREELRARIYNQFGRVEDSDGKEREFLSKKVEEVRDGYRSRAERAEESAALRAREAEKASSLETEAAVKKMSASHARETSRLKEDVRISQEAPKRTGDSTDLIRSMELENQAKLMAVDGARRADQEAAARRLRETEDYLSRQGDERVRDETGKSTERLRGQQRSMDEERKMLETQFAKNIEQRDQMMKKEKAYWGQRFQDAGVEAQDRQTRALNKQHDQFGEYAREQARSNKDIQNRLESSVQRLRTTDDPKEISAAAENALRTSIAVSQSKVKEAEDRSRKESERARSENQRLRYESVLAENQDRVTDLSRANAKALSEQGRMLGSIVEDERRAKTEGFRKRDDAMERSFDQQSKEYAEALNAQRRQFDENMSVLKDTSLARIEALKQESSDRERLLRREHSFEMGATIRDYEKRLADHKRESEAIIKETKQLAEKTVRDNDRKSKQLLDEYARNYENRRAHAELQQKERERVMSESFQDQMDKIKHSHALQLQKANEKKS